MTEDIKIYFYTQPVDMRKSMDTLCVMVAEVLRMNPTDGYLFLFRSKSGNKHKNTTQIIGSTRKNHY